MSRSPAILAPALFLWDLPAAILGAQYCLKGTENMFFLQATPGIGEIGNIQILHKGFFCTMSKSTLWPTRSLILSIPYLKRRVTKKYTTLMLSSLDHGWSFKAQSPSNHSHIFWQTLDKNCLDHLVLEETGRKISPWEAASRA